MNKEQCIELVLECVKSYGEMEGVEALISASENTKLFGGAGLLDSMGVVTITVEVQQVVAERLDRHVMLADEKAMSQQTSPFRNVSSLGSYLHSLLQEEE